MRKRYSECGRLGLNSKVHGAKPCSLMNKAIVTRKPKSRIRLCCTASSSFQRGKNLCAWQKMCFFNTIPRALLNVHFCNYSSMFWLYFCTALKTIGVRFYAYGLPTLLLVNQYCTLTSDISACALHAELTARAKLWLTESARIRRFEHNFALTPYQLKHSSPARDYGPGFATRFLWTWSEENIFRPQTKKTNKTAARNSECDPRSLAETQDEVWTPSRNKNLISLRFKCAKLKELNRLQNCW